MRKRSKRIGAVFGATVIAAGTALATTTSADAASKGISFNMVRSAAAQGFNCLKNASADVTVRSQGPVEVMKVSAKGLPPKTDFDVFVIQVPNTPFGVSWYQGDLESDAHGRAQQSFVGRFSIETFAVAPGVANAPVVHKKPPFPDAAANPKFGPIHTYHLGVWFNSPKDAIKACGAKANAVTPFNGDHTAGIQALSTRNFPAQFGPLRALKP